MRPCFLIMLAVGLLAAGDAAQAQSTPQGPGSPDTPERLEQSIVRLESANGMVVGLLPRDTGTDRVSLSLILRFGSLESLTGRAPAGQILAQMLLAELRLGQTARAGLAPPGTEYQIIGGGITVQAQIHTTRESLLPAIDLLADVLTAPSLTSQTFELVRSGRDAALRLGRTDLQFRTMGVLEDALTLHPQGHPERTAEPDEALQDLVSLTVDDAVAFHRDFFGAAAATVAVVGALDVDTVAAHIDAAFGDWIAPRPFMRISGTSPAPAPRTIEVQVPGATDGFTAAALPLPIRDDHPDADALALASFILGGPWGGAWIPTRLVRQDGLAIGAGAALTMHPLDPRGRFVAFALHGLGDHDAVETGMREELARVGQGGIRQGELDAAKTAYLDFARQERSTNAALAGMITSNLYFGRSLAWQAEREERIRSLTVDGVTNAVARWLDPAGLTVVKAGDYLRRRGG